MTKQNLPTLASTDTQIALSRVSTSLSIANKLLANIDPFEQHWRWWNGFTEEWKRELTRSYLHSDEDILEVEHDKQRMREVLSALIAESVITISCLSQDAFQYVKCLSYLKNLSELKLSFWDMVGYIELDFVQSLPKLKSLELASYEGTGVFWTPVDIDDISYLTSLKHLENLVFGGQKLYDISPLAQLISLKSLEFTAKNISDFSVLKHLKNLRSLQIGYANIPSLDFINKLPVLQELRMDVCEFNPEMMYLPRDLRSLFIRCNQLNNIDFVERIQNLNSLDCSFNNISDISGLSNLTQLTAFRAAVNKISNISCLSNLKGLIHLNLGMNQISTIEHLTDLTNLRFLNLQDNNISNISMLSQLKNLSTLVLSGNPISQWQVDQLREILPNCWIDFEMHPSNIIVTDVLYGWVLGRNE